MPHPNSLAAGWTSPQVAARYFGVSDRTILNWIKAGQLEGVRVGPRLWRIPVAALEAPIAS